MRPTKKVARSKCNLAIQNSVKEQHPMKKQIHSTIKAHLIRGTFYLLLLVAVCAIPFALAQHRSVGSKRFSNAVIPSLKQQKSVKQRAASAASDSLNQHGAQSAKKVQPRSGSAIRGPAGVINCDNEPGIVIHDDGTVENGYSGNPFAGVTTVIFADKFTPAVYP